VIQFFEKFKRATRSLRSTWI